MIMILMAIFLTLFGLVFGSFIDAVTWRIRNKRNFISERSECEFCHHKLGPLDLIPVFSWVMLGGKCRYCKKPISRLAPLTELAMGGLFLLSFAFWPLGFDAWQAQALFVLWLIYLVMLGMLFVYDLRWGLLPDVIVYPLIALGFLDAGLQTSFHGGSIASFATHIVLGVLAMAGVYGALYAISKGKWVGFGDVKLAVFVGSVLGWEKTLLVLMLSNIIGLLVVAPGLLSKKLTPKSQIPFGPFIIAAFVIAGVFGDQIVGWYVRTFLLI